jgi:hypothetical protein
MHHLMLENPVNRRIAIPKVKPANERGVEVYVGNSGTAEEVAAADGGGAVNAARVGPGREVEEEVGGGELGVWEDCGCIDGDVGADVLRGGVAVSGLRGKGWDRC